MISQKILVEFCDINCKFTIIALDLLPKVKPSLLRREASPCSGVLHLGKKERRRPPSLKRKLRASSSQVVNDSKSSDGPTPQDGSTKWKNTDSIQVSQQKSPKTKEFTVASDLKPLPSQ